MYFMYDLYLPFVLFVYNIIVITIIIIINGSDRLEITLYFNF
jgi:hypothetical protein